MRVALIHAPKHSIAPVETSFARLWSDAGSANLLDDTTVGRLSHDGTLVAAATGHPTLTTPGSAMRFADPAEQAPNIARVRRRLQSLASPGVTIEVHGMSPPDRHFHPITGFRCAQATLEAERAGCTMRRPRRLHWRCTG
jgi:hypothetical protein